MDLLDELVARARTLVADDRRAVLGITGSPAAGKSTLAAELTRRLGALAAHVPMDGFHLADVALERLGRRHRKGAVDTFDAGGYLALLRRLTADTEDVVYAPQFERDIEQPVAGAIAVPRSARLVVTEGNYLLLPDPAWRAVAAELAEVWFCALPERVRHERLLARHVRFGKSPAAAAAWVEAVDAPNAALIDATRGRADLVVPIDDVLG